MLIARVIGDVVATQKAASHIGRKILIVQPLNLDGSDRGEPVLALDAVDAGEGDRVLLSTEGYSAMTAVGRPNSPIDSAVSKRPARNFAASAATNGRDAAEPITMRASSTTPVAEIRAAAATDKTGKSNEPRRRSFQ